MIAFVLGGGGNRGALQVGAIQVLLEAGIRPDLLVGTSVGSLNAAYLASDPTPAGARRLEEIWLKMGREQILPGGPMGAARHGLTGRDFLFPAEGLRSLAERYLPSGVSRFGHLRLPLFVVATRQDDGSAYIFGEDPVEELADALVASCAVPTVFPALAHRGQLLVDGGMVANLPVGVSVEHGATEVYALELVMGDLHTGKWPSLVDVAVRSIVTMLRGQTERELRHCSERHPDIVLHHLVLRPSAPLALDHFSCSGELIEEVRKAAREFIFRSDAPQLEVGARERAADRGTRRRPLHSVGNDHSEEAIENQG